MKTKIKPKSDIKKATSEAGAALGRIGGKVVAKRGKAYMRKIGKKGASARWSKEKNKSIKLPKNFGKMK